MGWAGRGAVAGGFLAAAVLAGCASTSTTGKDLSVVAGSSSCVANEADATIAFLTAIRNTGTGEEKTTIRPWRRYNDASVNNGVGDETAEVAIPAGATMRFRTVVPYQATKHLLIECRVILGSDTQNATSVAVVR